MVKLAHRVNYTTNPLHLDCPDRWGVPRLKGQRLPTLGKLLQCPDVGWTKMSVAWCDGAIRTVEIVSQTAVWYHTGKPPVPIRWVLIRDLLHQFDSQALLCTDPAISPVQIIEWFVLRWHIEVTPYPVRGRLFQETRAHLGVETQRQWSDRAIPRTTPVLLGDRRPATPRSAAWYVKSVPTFIDAIANVQSRASFPSCPQPGCDRVS